MASPSPTPDEIAGIECKHVQYVTARDGSPNDLLLVKELIHFKDGRPAKSNLRRIINYEREFWVTRGDNNNRELHGHRNHRSKKEWEDQNKLQRFTSTQVQLPTNVYRALGQMPPKFVSLRNACQSPYVYGADITSAVLMKHRYIEKFPNFNGPKSTTFSVCNLDIETDMVRGTEEVIMVSLVMDGKIKLIVSETYLEGILQPEKEIRSAIRHYLGEILDGLQRTFDITIDIVKDAASACLLAIQTAHAWHPDILAIWNMDFDIPKISKQLERAGYDLGEVWSDPCVPPAFRTYQYIQGTSQKKTQSGKTMPLPFFDRWHSVVAPSSFAVLDAMCVYRKLRIAKGMEGGGYGLDNILTKHGLKGKLKFAEADHVTGGQWHAFMQRFHRIEYCVYNIYDSLSMLLLDDQKTGDLGRMIGLHSGHSEFSKFPSQPRRTWDDMHFECLKRGKVAATTAAKMEDELDQYVYPLTGWIVTLPSHQVFNDGVKCVKELPDFNTMVFVHVAD